MLKTFQATYKNGSKATLATEKAIASRARDAGLTKQAALLLTEAKALRKQVLAAPGDTVLADQLRNVLTEAIKLVF